MGEHVRLQCPRLIAILLLKRQSLGFRPIDDLLFCGKVASSIAGILMSLLDWYRRSKPSSKESVVLPQQPPSSLISGTFLPLYVYDRHSRSSDLALEFWTWRRVGTKLHSSQARRDDSRRPIGS